MSEAPRRPLYVFLIATLAVGALGSVFIQPAIATWYAGLAKPWFDPPNWVFAPVWTTLYVLMAVAAWRVWRLAGHGTPEIGLYGAQLALNLGWCITFFGLHRVGAALGVIGLLWAATLATLVLFWRRDRLAGLLFLPVFAWTGFAALLNWAIWRLNGG